MADDDVELTGMPPASPLPRRMWILAAVCLAVAAAAIAGIFVTGAAAVGFGRQAVLLTPERRD